MLPGSVPILKRVNSHQHKGGSELPGALDQVRIKALVKASAAKGKKNGQKTSPGEAPRVRAMNSIRWSDASKAVRMSRDGIGEVDQDVGHDNARGRDHHLKALFLQPFAGR